MKSLLLVSLSALGVFFGTLGVFFLKQSDLVCHFNQTSIQNQDLVQVQSDCKIQDDHDEFTKTRRVISGPFSLFHEKFKLKESKLSGFSYTANANVKETEFAIYFYPEWKDGERSLCILRMIYQVAEYMEFPRYDPNPKVMFILANDEILTLVPYVIEDNKLQTNGWLSQRQFFNLNDSTWAMLRDTPPKKMRLRYLGSNRSSIHHRDVDIALENQDLVSFAFSCIDELKLD